MKLVKREVVRVITPGTAIDSQLVEAKEPMFLAAIVELTGAPGAGGANGACGAAFLDLSTGQFSTTQIDGSDAWNKCTEQVLSFSPRELLFPTTLAKKVRDAFGGAISDPILGQSADNRQNNSLFALTEIDQEFPDHRFAEESLINHFGTKTLDGFGLAGKKAAIAAAAMCLKYATETQKATAEHISEIDYFETSDFMILDGVTQRNLEIFETRSDSPKRTLLNVIDETVTGMGGRLLRAWISRPSIKRSEIQTRQSAVTELCDPILREKLRYLLKEVSDLERLTGRLNLGNASPRDILALKQTLDQAPLVNEVLSDANSLLIQVLAENIFELPEVRDLIARSVADEPPVNLTDGGVIREGFDADLDELRSLSTSGKQNIAAIEDRERERTGIPTLKVRFNNVFGYYIEVSKAQLGRVPDDFQRKQTLANAERFSTPELKQWEEKVLGAEEKIISLEAELFNKVRDQIKEHTRQLQSTARALATLDALAALAENASRRNYVCPTLHDGDEIEIKNGRHPVVEAYTGGSFVSNDLYLNNSTDRLLIVTGANMGGKSTILRQVALIQVLAQIGAFVPATSARLPIVDRIWTRVGASDDLASGRSTFMVEMTETAAILHNATPRSLVLLDEIGRGTSTFDGLSIAWAVAEYLHNSPDHSAKTLFATHYHELTELAEHLPGAKNYQITASEKDGQVVFLHKLIKGKASKSYGIAVARLAGLPQAVIDQAVQVLDKLEKYELAVFGEGSEKKGLAMAASRSAASQFSLFAISNETAINELRESDTDAMTPESALELVRSLKSKII